LNEAPIEWDDKQIYEHLKILLDKIKPDAFIVRDFAVIQALRKIQPNVKLHISSLAQVWNENALNFYKDFLGENFERFIFSRDIA
jgi:collagenase-like PrtC family protease